MKIPLSPLLLAALLGCGGGSSSSGGDPAPQRRGVVRIDWPERPSRLVPSAANSVVVTLSKGGVPVGSQTVARPTSEAVFEGLAYGHYDVGVAAYPSTDGLATDPAAVPQGTGAGGMDVSEDHDGDADVATASTVARLAVSPGAVAFDKGQSATVGVSATDAQGRIVVLGANGGTEPVAWTLKPTGFATLNANGLSATLRGTHSTASATGLVVSASMVVDDAGAKVAATAPVTVNAIDDGTGTVGVH